MVVTLDGRNDYLGPYGSPESQREYDRVIQKWLANGRIFAPTRNASQPGPGHGLTVSELILRYWAFAEEYYSRDGVPGRGLGNIKDALRPLRQSYGTTPAGTFGPVTLKAVRKSMIDADLARNTINARVGKIRRMFKWAVAEELVPRGSFRTYRRSRASAPDGRGSAILRPSSRPRPSRWPRSCPTSRRRSAP